MKEWLVFILLLLTTAGTFIPCCEVDNCCSDQVNTARHDKHQNEGICSPFFACASCPGFVELAKPIQLAQPVTEKIIHHQNPVQFSFATYASSFWQPPRS